MQRIAGKNLSDGFAITQIFAGGLAGLRPAPGKNAGLQVLSRAQHCLQTLSRA